MRKDLYHNVEPVVAINYQAATGAVTGNTIDVKGYESIDLQLLAHTVTTADASNYLTVALFEGDESDMSDEAAVATTNILGSLPVIDGDTADNSIQHFGYKGNKRYIRMKIVETGTASATLTGAAVKGNPHQAPVN